MTEILAVLLLANVVLLSIGIVMDHRTGGKADRLSAKIEDLEGQIEVLIRGPHQSQPPMEREHRNMFSQPRFKPECGDLPGPKDRF